MKRPAVVAVAAMVAIPLLRRGGPGRRLASSAVVVGLAGATAGRASNRWGPTRTTLVGAAVLATTWSVEYVGVAAGRPFGRYRYTDALRPRVGAVPAIVPLAWFAMAVPAREVAHAAFGSRSTAARRILGGAAALTAWDLFLDPQMVAEGYWRWERPGRYRGIPCSNFVGWFVVAAAVMAMLELGLPAGERADAGLVGEYAGMALMETLAFATFFGDRLVATVGGAAMLPPAVGAVARLVRDGPRPDLAG